MLYSIKHLEYHLHVVTNDYGRCFQGTLLHCEEYVKAASGIAPLETIENPAVEFLVSNED